MTSKFSDILQFSNKTAGSSPARYSPNLATPKMGVISKSNDYNSIPENDKSKHGSPSEKVTPKRRTPKQGTLKQATVKQEKPKYGSPKHGPNDSAFSPGFRRKLKRHGSSKLGVQKDAMMAKLLDAINCEDPNELRQLLDKYREETDRITNFLVKGATLLHYACSRSNAEVVEILLGLGFNVNLKVTEPVEMYLEAYDCPSVFREGTTPIYIATVSGHDKVMTLLARSGANINCRDADSFTPLHNAAWNNKVDLIQGLASYGADLNAGDDTGSSPLRKAAYRGNLDAVKTLIEAGCDLNTKTKRGRTALHSSAYNGHAAVTQLLISRGATINIQDADGVTPLHAAVYNGQRSTVKALLRAKATVTVGTNLGNTPLHMACTEKQFVIAKYLIKSGADINAKNRFGESAVNILEQTLTQEQAANVLTRSHYQKDYLEKLETDCKVGPVFKPEE